MIPGDGPYVGLDYFREEHADLFFGRDAERRRIMANLRAARLTLLYAESGVGKSSLLRAGVVARLRALAERDSSTRRYVPVVFSAWTADPTAGLVAALAQAVQRLPDAGAPPALDAGLEPALEAAAAAANATPLVILDQFEERFLYADPDDFEQALARCVNRRDLHVNFLISIREDAYAQLGARFKALIPNVYGNYLRLDFLDVRAAREAAINPLEAFNKRSGARWAAEPALVEQVIDGVRRGRVTVGDGARADENAGRVETAYLQLVMQRIWAEEAAAGSDLLRLETLTRLGGVDRIIRSHLDDAMATLPPAQREASTEALRFFVTSSGRKIALSDAEVREFSQLPDETLVPALDHLERERILRRVPVAGGGAAREIYHDVLAPAILDWRRRQLEERRRAEDRRRLARLEWRNRRLAAVVVALAAAVLALGAYALNPDALRRLELSTVDARFRLRPAQAPHPDIALVGFDDRSAQLLADLTPRAAFARLIARIDSAAPRAIAVDVPFDSPDADRRDRAGTEQLRRAVAAAGHPVVLAFANFGLRTGPGGARQVSPAVLATTFSVTPPDCRVRGTPTALGYAGLPQDPDRAERRMETSAPTSGGVDLCPFNMVTARLVTRVDTQALRTAPRRARAGQTDQTAWIDFPGPAGTLRAVSAVDVLNGRAPVRALRGKLVVIGITEGDEDLHQTPFPEPMRGAEVQAHAIATILDGAPLRDVSPLVELALVLALALVAPLATLMLRSPMRIAAPVLAAGVAFVLAAYLAFLAGRVVSAVIPLTALLLGAAGALVVELALRRAWAPRESDGR